MKRGTSKPTTPTPSAESPALRAVTGRDPVAELVKERDAAIGAEMHAVQRADAAEADAADLAAERDALVLERDALRDVLDTRALPTYAEVLTGKYAPEQKPGDPSLLLSGTVETFLAEHAPKETS